MNWNIIIGIVKPILDNIFDLTKKYGLKFIALIVVCIVCIGVVGYYFNYKTTKDVEKLLKKHEDIKLEQHRKAYSSSIKSYNNIKQLLKKEYQNIKASHILYLEYHNGGENIATGYQFSKFDILMEITNPDNPYIRIDEYKDENILHYDIFYSERILNHKISIYTTEELVSIDRNFYHIIDVAHPEYIMFCNVYMNNMIAGTVIFIFKDNIDNEDYISIINTVSSIENIINSSNI